MPPLIAGSLRLYPGRGAFREDVTGKTLIKAHELPADLLITHAAPADLPDTHDGVGVLCVAYRVNLNDP